MEDSDFWNIITGYFSTIVKIFVNNQGTLSYQKNTLSFEKHQTFHFSVFAKFSNFGEVIDVYNRITTLKSHIFIWAFFWFIDATNNCKRWALSNKNFEL